MQGVKIVASIKAEYEDGDYKKDLKRFIAEGNFDGTFQNISFDVTNDKKGDHKTSMLNRLTMNIPIKNEAMRKLIDNATAEDLDSNAAANYSVEVLNKA